MKNTEAANVVVIVASRNEAQHLKACVDSLLESSKGRAEIVFVDDASTDDSRNILQAYGSKIRVLSGEGRGPGRARNLALGETKRPFVAFVDGDCRVAPDWLDQLCTAFDDDPHLAAVGGIQRVDREAGATERKIAGFLETVGFVSDYVHQNRGKIRVKHNPTCNVLYRREALEAVSGFDETLWPCEDLDLDLRLKKKGYYFLCTPGAIVEHRRPTTWRGFFRMMRRYGFAHAQLAKKHGLCQKIHMLPITAPFALATFLLCVSRSPQFALLLFVGVAVLFALLFLSRVGVSVRAIVSAGMLVPATLSWLFGFYSGVPGKRRVSVKRG